MIAYQLSALPSHVACYIKLDVKIRNFVSDTYVVTLNFEERIKKQKFIFFQILKKIRTFLKNFFKKKTRRKKIQISSTSTFQATFSKNSPFNKQQDIPLKLKIYSQSLNIIT